MKAADGLSHHGDPAEEEEVIVVEEPERPTGSEPRVVRAPRVPTQRENEESPRLGALHFQCSVTWLSYHLLCPIVQPRQLFLWQFPMT